MKKEIRRRVHDAQQKLITNEAKDTDVFRESIGLLGFSHHDELHSSELFMAYELSHDWSSLALLVEVSGDDKHNGFVLL